MSHYAKLSILLLTIALLGACAPSVSKPARDSGKDLGFLEIETLPKGSSPIDAGSLGRVTRGMTYMEVINICGDPHEASLAVDLMTKLPALDELVYHTTKGVFSITFTGGRVAEIKGPTAIPESNASSQIFAETKKKAEKGDAKAQCNLGAMYAGGQGVAQDYAMAEAWYEKAAKQGDAQAQAALKKLPK
jgi:hypothetical protein